MSRDCGCAGRQAKKIGFIRYEVYPHGGYLLIDIGSEKDQLIQLDYDFPSLARDFGWDGKLLPEEELCAVNLSGVGNSTGAEIYSAIQYLDENEGKEVEDPGYFPMDVKEMKRRMNAKKLRDENCEFPAFAWPGGYPLFYLMEDGEVICPKCANEEDEVYADEDPAPETPDRQWHIVDSDAHWEGLPLICANCNAEIHSAYGPTDYDYTDMIKDWFRQIRGNEPSGEIIDKCLDFVRDKDNDDEGNYAQVGEWVREFIHDHMGDNLGSVGRQVVGCQDPIETTLGIQAIYDNGGRSADRYAVYITDSECLCLSVDCNMPNGVNMWGVGRFGPHNGRVISFEQLPAQVKRCVISRIQNK